jgi:hypothetical protein
MGRWPRRDRLADGSYRYTPLQIAVLIFYEGFSKCHKQYRPWAEAVSDVIQVANQPGRTCADRKSSRPTKTTNFGRKLDADKSKPACASRKL